MCDFTIRRYLSTDRDAVWALHNRALLLIGAHAGNGPWDRDVRHVERDYLNSGGEFLVAALGAELIAMGGVRRAGDRAGEIKRMRTEPAYQRRGYGRRLLEALDARARDLGISTLWLETPVRQAAARRVYESAGYAETGRRVQGCFEVLTYQKLI